MPSEPPTMRSSLTWLRRQVKWKVSGLETRAARLSERASALAPASPGRPLHVGVVLAGWDPAHTQSSLGLLEARARQLCRRGVKWSVVAVANDEAVFSELTNRARSGVTLVRGSNHEGEFSAYDEGYQVLLEDAGRDVDILIVANDRLARFPRPLLALNEGALRIVSQNPVACGTVHVIVSPQPGQSHRPACAHLWGYELSSYIRSNWVVIGGDTLARVGTLRSVTADAFGQHAPDHLQDGLWPLSPWLGDEVASWLRDWLTVEGNWWKAQPLTEASWPTLRFKALAMLNEQLLSARLVRAGVGLLPWAQAQALSALAPRELFVQRALQAYAHDPDFGRLLESSPAARIQLSAAVMAERSRLPGLAGRLLRAAMATVNAPGTRPGPL